MLIETPTRFDAHPATPNYCVNLIRNGVAAAGYISFSPAPSTPLRAGYKAS